MKEERDNMDEMFRTKLYDFEAETAPGDWDAIESRLKKSRRAVLLPGRGRYVAAAAVVALLLMTGGVYLMQRTEEQPVVAGVVIQKHSNAPEQPEAEPTISTETSSEKPTLAAKKKNHSERNITEVSLSVISSKDEKKEEAEEVTSFGVVPKSEGRDAVRVLPEEESKGEGTELIAEASTDRKPSARKNRWGFGMGAGSISAGASNSLNTYALKNTSVIDRELLFLNSANFETLQPKTNVKHKTPVSVGLSVSYALNDRLSLVSGLNYTLLSSSWETTDTYHNETTQKLHFLGIPLSLSYEIARWKSFVVYGAAGAMAEVNVAGKLTTEKYMHRELYEREVSHIRMKPWLWSVNARAGVSYPLIRFVSLYAEVGADYYFDNGSVLETVRSEKPFNLKLQAGFRLGF